MAAEAGQVGATEMKGLAGAGMKRPGGNRESEERETDGTQTEQTWQLTVRHSSRVGLVTGNASV